MRGRRDFEPIDGFQRDVQRRVDPDGDLGTAQIVVDRRRDPNDRESHPPQGVRAGLRAVAANDDQSVDRHLVERFERLPPSDLRAKLVAASTAENGAAALDDAADVTRAQDGEVSFDQPGEPPTDANDFPSTVEAAAHDRANCRVHSRGVTAAG